MITSLFLLFVAAGITMASTVYGFGGVFPMMLAAGLVAVLFHVFVARRKTEAFNG